MSKKYPSQDEAELVIDALTALNDVHIGYAHNSAAARIVETASKKLAEEYHRIFQSPVTSPWELNRNPRGKLTRRDIRWRNGWGEQKEL